jgi:endonuclease/exonuclease/phosphatase family metal-dependent hydrolase
MKALKTIILVGFIILHSAGFGQQVDFFMDGISDDWSHHIVSYQDDSQDGGASDILDIAFSNDADYLYLKIVMKTPVLLNNSDLWLYLDTDRDAATGYEVGNLGAELSWSFGDRYGFYNSPTDRIYHNQIGFSALPTVSSERFEIRISRHSRPDGTHLLFNDNTLRVLVKSSTDQAPDAGAYFEYEINDQLVNSFQPLTIHDPLPGQLRLLSYNILHDGLLKPGQKPALKRIIKYVNPHFIVFNECWETTAAQAKEILDDFIALPGTQGWHTLKKDGGNILCSRYPFKDSWQVYPDTRITAAIIDLPDKDFNTDLMLTGAHFRCCDANAERQREADAFAAFVLDALTPGGRVDIPKNTPIVLSGDLNLVGDAQQLQTLLTGQIINTQEFGEGGNPHWDQTQLEDVISTHTHNPTAVTWVNNTSSYWPGRLDYTITTNSVLKTIRSFIVQTTEMPESSLLAAGLEADDSPTASDHLPKITDFQILSNSRVSQIKETPFKIYPNPAKHQVLLEFDGTVQLQELQLYQASTGKKMPVKSHQQELSDGNQVHITGLQPGVYLIRLKIANQSPYFYKKIIITK